MTLAILNELRIRNGKTELKSWKESKAKLAERIEIEKAIADASAQAERVEASAKNKPVVIEAVSSGKANEFKLNAAGKAAVKKAKQKEANKLEANKINVAQIAKELGINPKVARAKLRKANVDRTSAAAIRKALTK